HLHMGNGLAANETDQYGFFEDSDGSIWIAGEEGITHFRPDHSWFDGTGDAPPPQVTRVEADGQVFVTRPESLPSGTKTVRIDLGTLRSSPFRDVALRYRLLPSKDWQISRDGNLEFRNLAQREYTLEAGYTGGATGSVYKFRIGSGAAWLSWLWILLPAGAV